MNETNNTIDTNGTLRRLSWVVTTGLMLGIASTSQAAAADDACAPEAYAMALRYQQQSAEVDALQRQSYALATARLQQKIAAHPEADNLAIMTDLDETVIDNSALLVRDMQACHDFTGWDTWKVWEREGHPRLIPGARKFLNYADSQGVTIFYVSDRYEENKASTLATLRSLHLPQVSDAQVRLLGPSKGERRAAIERDHDLVLQLGDSLADFSSDFHHADLKDQHRLVAEDDARFGDDWIMFPNASYGSWSDADLEAWAAPLKTR